MSTLAPRIAELAEQAEQLHQVLRRHCSTAQVHFTKAQNSFNTTLQHANIHPKAALYAGLVLVTFIWLVATFTRHLRTRARNQLSPPSTPNLEKRSPFKAPERPPGGTIIFFPTTTCHSQFHPN